MTNDRSDRWTSGPDYDAYIGRWSRAVALEFVDWLAVSPGRRWLDVGCGTGALTEAILARAAPDSVVGVDPSASFVEHARQIVVDPRARFAVASASATDLGTGEVDVVASGLVLNFVPDIGAALAEARRAVRAGGVVAGYVWDYAEGMQLLRSIWDAAVALDPAARQLDEASRFPLAAPGPLADAFTAAGLESAVTRPVDVATTFADFNDLWMPFRSGTGPAPAYVASLPAPAQAALRDRLRATIPQRADGSIALTARAWAVRARSPGPESVA